MNKLQYTIPNNTFDFDSLNETMTELKESSFGYLYQVQKDSVGIQRFDFKMRDLKKEKFDDYSISIDVDMINPSYIGEYHSSAYYKKRIKRDEIYGNKFFLKSFICIVNGFNANLWDVFCNGNSTRFILPIISKNNSSGITSKEFEVLATLNASITIFILPNNRLTSSYSSFNDINSLKNYSETITVPYGKEYFDIPLKGMPVPISSILVFDIKNGVLKFNHDIQLKLYYPNIYQISGKFYNDLQIVVFYKQDLSLNFKYKNELNLFYKYTKNVVDLYNNKTIPDIIKNYKPFEFVYGVVDYEKNFYRTEDELSYKTNRFKEWIAKNNEFAIPYLAKEIATRKTFNIDISKINLANRLKDNNYSECPGIDTKEDFDYPLYVLKFKDLYENYIDYKFFIDGLYVIPERYYNWDGFIYYYFNTKDIKENSFIEIERSRRYDFNQIVSFSEDEVAKQIEIESNGFSIYANDVFLVDRATDQYISKDDYIVNGCIDGIDIQLEKDSFFNIAKSDIMIVKSSLYNKRLDVHVKKVGVYEELTVTEDKPIQTIYLNEAVSNDDRNIRVFKNGRLVPYKYFTVDFTDYYSEPSKIELVCGATIGDKLVVDYAPNKYKEIYAIKEIDEKGFVDLTGIIKRPFDLRWYDIYVNGRKLNATNIESITATKFFITGIESIRNIDIYEKDRDDEYFKIGDGNINELLIQGVSTLFNTIYGGKDVINETEDDILSNVGYEVTDSFVIFYLYLVNLFINPDLDQVTEEMRKKFPELFKTTGPFFINPDDYPYASLILNIGR